MKELWRIMSKIVIKRKGLLRRVEMTIIIIHTMLSPLTHVLIALKRHDGKKEFKTI